MTRLLASIIDTSGLPNTTTTTTNSTAFEANVINLVFAIAASVALLMVVIGGFRYITARGDPNATASARNGIMYALVGLVLIMAAYSIVAFTVKGVI